MLRPAQRRLVLLTTAFALSLLSCGREVTGPENGINFGRRVANIAIAPQMPSLMTVVEGAGDAVPFTKVRVLLRNQDGTVAKDTLIDFPSDAEEVSLSLQIPIPITAPDSGLPLSLTMAYVNASGDTVFKGGPNTITARPVGSSGANVPVVIPVTYEGTGKDADTVRIAPKTGTGVAGTTQAFSGTAKTATGSVIANTPFVFYTLDSTRVQVNAATGIATWLPVRGNARIVAALPSGLRADTATFLVTLPASKLVLGAGDAQTGAVNAPLADSIVVRTLASDDVPVAGVIVNFAVVTGGGSVLTLTDTSDALGNVSTKWTLGGLIGMQSITATSVGLTGSPLTITATGVAGTPTSLEIVSQPTTVTAGTVFTPAIVVEARDAFGNIASTFTGAVNIVVDGMNPPPTGGTLTRNAVAGVATFNDLSLALGGSYQLVVTSGALTPDTTATVTITPAAASRLEFVTQPAGAMAGAAFVPPVTVRALDAFGNLDTAYVGSVTLGLLNGGAAVLSGGTGAPVTNGFATFSSLSVNLVGATYSLEAFSATLTTDTSSVFGITPSAPTQIALISGGAQTGAVSNTLAQPIVVEVRDAQGNLVPSATVNFNIVSGGGTAIPTSAATNASGQASTSWTLGTLLGAQQLEAVLAAAPGVSVLVPATATAGAPAQVVITASPTSGVAGTAFSAIVAEVRDANGNLVPTYTGTVVLSLGSSPVGASLLGVPSTAAVGGVATFDNVFVEKAGAGYTLVATAEGFDSPASASFSVSAGAAAQFGLEDGDNQTGGAVAAMANPLRVYVRDAFGNPVAGHPTQWTVATGASSVGSATVLTDVDGIASNTAVFGTLAGTMPAVSVTADGVAGTVTFNVTVTGSAATALTITAPAPGAQVAGTALPTISVSARDAFGNPTSFADTIRAVIETGPAGGTFAAGDTAVLAVGGVSLFNNLKFNVAGVYTLEFVASGLTSVQHPPITVSAAAAAYLLAATPSGDAQTVVAGDTASAFRVQATDAYGNPVSGVSVTWTPGLGGGSFVAGSSITDANGVAEGVFIAPTAPGEVDATASVALLAGSPVVYTVTVTPAPASQLALTQSANPAVVNAVATPSFIVSARDAFNNPAVATVGTVTVEIESGPVGAVINGTTTQPFASAFAEFADLSFSKPGVYALRFISSSVSDTVGIASYTVSADVPASLVLVSGDAQSSGPLSTVANPLEVRVLDQYGNPVPNVLVSFTAITSNANVTLNSVLTDATGLAATEVVMATEAGAVQVDATVSGVGTPVTFNLTLTAGTPDAIVEVIAPQSGTAGTALPSFTFEVRDVYGNVVSSFGDSARVQIRPVSGSPIFIIGSGDTTTAVNGVISFPNLVITQAGVWELVVKSGALPDGISVPITIAAAAPAMLGKAGGDGQSGTVGAGFPLPLRARVTDSYGNPVSGVNVNFNLLSGSATVVSSVVATDLDGYAETGAIFGNTSGAIVLGAFAAGLTPDSILFNAFATPSAPASFIIASGNAQTVPAGGIAADSVVFYVLDAFGNNVPNAAVIAATSDDITLLPGALTSDATGRFAVEVTAGGSLGSKSFEISSGGATPIYASLDVIAGAATALDVTVEPTTTVAGDAITSIQVAVKDAFGNLAISFADSVVASVFTHPGGNPITGTLRRAVSGGMVTFDDLALTSAGVYSLKFEWAGLTPDTTISFIVTPAAANALQLVQGDGQSMQPSANAADSLKVRVVDLFGNPVSGVTVNWTTMGSASISAPVGITDAAGETAVELIASTLAETSEVQAASTGLLGSPLSFNYTVTAGAAVLLEVETEPTNATAGTPVSTITLRAKDAYGNVAGDFNGDVTVLVDSGPASPAITGTQTKAAAGGIATFTDISIQTAGTYRLRFQSPGLADTVSVMFVVSPAGPAVFESVSGDAQSGVVLTTLSNPLRVRVTDSYGNGVSGVTVNFNSLDGFATFVDPTPVTDAEGYAEGVVTLGDSATIVNLAAFVGGLTPDSLGFTATALADAPSGFTLVSGDAQTAQAGSAAADSVIVRVKDGYGNNVAGVSVTFTTADDLTFSDVTVVSDAAGLAATRVIGGATLGLKTFAAEAVGASPISLTVTVEPGAPSVIEVISTPSGTSAGTVLSALYAEVRDAFGNIVTGYSDSLDVVVQTAPVGGSVTGRLRVATVSGTASFDSLTFDIAGDYSLRVLGSGLTDDTTQTFTITAGAATQMEKVSGDLQSATVGQRLANPLVVRLLDQFGNVVPGVPVSWGVSVGSAVVDSAQYVTDASGLSEMGVTLANVTETAEVTATYSSLSVTFSGQGLAAAASQMIVLTQPAGGVAGDTLTAFSVQLLDAYFNVASYADSVTLQFQSAPAMPSLAGTLKVPVVGSVATFNDIVLTRAGSYSFRFTAPGVADTVSDVFSIATAPATQISAGRGDGQTVSLQSPVDTLGAFVIDAFGNPVAGVPVTWTVPSGQLDSLYTTAITDASGYALAAVASQTTAGSFSVIATSAGLIDSPVAFTVTVLAGTEAGVNVLSVPTSVTAAATADTMSVEIVDEYGNRVLTFAGPVVVSVNDGPSSVIGGTISVLADSGVARFGDISFSVAGNYTLQFEATGVGTDNASLTVLPGAPAVVSIDSGNFQTQYATFELDSAAVVRVTDAIGNGISGVDVVFKVRAGSDAKIGSGVSQDTVSTDAFGYARTTWILGTATGDDSLYAFVPDVDTVAFTATALELMGNRVWSGDISTDWTTAGNWVGGLVPTASDSVFIPASRPNYPALTGDVSMAQLFVADDVTGFAIGDHNVLVSGNIRLPEDTAAMTNGALGMLRGIGGGSHTLRGIMPRLTLENGNYDVEAPIGEAFKVFGHLLIDADARLTLDASDSLIVVGDFNTSSGGQLAQAAGSNLEVSGGVDFGGGSTAGLMTGGRLSISGSFSTSGVNADVFQPAAAHTTYLRGAVVTVSFATPDVTLNASCSASCFGRLVADSTLGIDSLYLLSGVKALGGFDLQLPRLDASGQQLVSPAAAVMRADSTFIGGFAFASTIDVTSHFAVDSLIGFGTGDVPVGSATTMPMTVRGDYILNGNYQGDLRVESGTLDIDGPSARVMGFFGTAGTGKLQMTDAADVLVLDKTGTFAGGSTNGMLTDGRLVAERGIKVTMMGAFSADTGHVTELSTGATDSLVFLSGGLGSDSSHFGTLELNKTAYVPMYVDGTLAVAGELRTMQANQRLVATEFGGRLRTRGAQISHLTFDGTPLAIEDGLGALKLDTLTFVNIDPNETQLRVARYGDTVYVRNPVFDSLASNTTYIDAVDLVADAESLTVKVVEPLPTFNNGRLAVNGAYITGWPNFEVFVWTNGGGDRIWYNPNNWSVPAFPGPLDSVVVTGEQPPIINAPAYARSLISTATAPIQIDNALHVSHQLIVPETNGATCDPVNGKLRMVTADTLYATGALACWADMSNGVLRPLGTLKFDSVSVDFSARLDIGADTLEVGHRFWTNGDGQLRMNDGNGVLRLFGVANFISAMEPGALTAGRLEVHSAFAQYGAATGYQASAGHTTAFMASSNQNVQFANPDSSSAGSHFGSLELAQSVGGVSVRFNSDAYVRGQIRGGEMGGTRAVSTQTTTPRRLIAAGADIYSDIDLNLNNVSLVFVDGAVLESELYSIRFSNMADSVTQLEVIRNTGSFTFYNFEFDSTALDPMYLVARDPDAGEDFAITMDNPSPAFNFGRYNTFDAFIYNWPDEPQFVWTGDANDNNWSNPANWGDNVVPYTGASIEISSSAYPPNSIPAGTYGSLDVYDPSLNINIDGVVTFRGSVNAPTEGESGLSCGGNPANRIVFDGANESEPAFRGEILCPIEIINGPVYLGGDARAKNVLVSTSGSLHIGEFELSVDSTFTTTTGGKLIMMDPAGFLIVNQQMLFDGGSTTDSLSAGTIRSSGGLLQGENGSVTSFDASGTHTVQLNDSCGSCGSIVVGQSYAQAGFQNLQIEYGTIQGNGAELNVRGDLDLGASVVFSNNASVTVGGYVAGDPTSALNLNSYELRVAGAWDFEGTWSGGSLALVGADQTLRTGRNYTMPIIVSGTVNFAGVGPDTAFALGASLTVRNGGHLHIARGDSSALVTVTGVFAVEDSARLVMQSYVAHLVTQDTARFNGGNSDGLLTAGVLSLYSDFVASGTKGEFRAGPSFLTRFAKDGPQRVFFANPEYTGNGSYFGDVALVSADPSARVNLASDIVLNGQLRVVATGGANLMQAVDGDRLVQAEGLNVPDSLHFEGVRLRIVDGDAIDAANGLRFSNLTENGIPSLEFRRVNGLIALNNASFDTGAGFTNNYLVALDMETAGDDTLKIDLGGTAEPGFHSGRIAELNGARILNWTELPQFIWTNAVDDDWSTAGNWSDNVVPSAADTAVIPVSASQNPVISAPTEVGVIINNATGLVVDVSSVLTVRRMIATEASMGILCTGGGIVKIEPTDTATVYGNIDCPTYVRSGVVRAIGNLSIGGNLQVDSVGTFIVDSGYTVALLEGASLFTLDSGRIHMQHASATLNVAGDATFAGGSTEGLLTNGSLTIGGSFSQTTNATAFAASGSHHTYLNANGGSVTFANPGVTASRFNDLTTLQPAAPNSPLPINSDIYVLGTLYQGSYNVEYNGGGTNRKLQVANLANSGSYFQFFNLRVVLVDGPSTSVSAVNFGFMDTTVPYLTVDRSGGTLSLSSIGFLNTPTATGKYLVAIDTVSNGDDLVVYVNEVQPTGHGGFIDSLGSASIQGWDQNALYTFTGAGTVGSDLNALDNWDVGAVPTSISTVRFNNAGSADSVTLGNVAYRSLTIESGAKVIVSAPLTATRDVTLNGEPQCTAGGSLNFQGDGGIRFLSGSAPTCAALMSNGSFAPQTNLSFRSVTVSTDGQLLLAGTDSLFVADTLATLGTGRIQTDDDNNAIIVEGLARLGGVGNSYFNAGTVNVQGALQIEGSLNAPGARLVLGDPSGTTTFTARTVGDNEFGFDSVFVLDGTLNILDSLVVRRYLGTIGSSGTVTGGKLRVGDPDYNVDGSVNLGETGTLTVSELDVFGRIDTVGTFNVATTSFLGQQSGPQEIPADNRTGVGATNYNYGLIRVLNDAIMNDGDTGLSYSIFEGIRILSGHLIVSGDGSYPVTVNMPTGDLIVDGFGARFTLEGTDAHIIADSVSIKSDTWGILDGVNTSLTIGSDLILDESLGQNTLLQTASITHVTRFTGSSGVIDMGTGFYDSYLRRVEFAGGRTTTLRSDLFIKNDVRRQSATTGLITFVSDQLAGDTRFIRTNGTSFAQADGSVLMRNVAFDLVSTQSSPSGYGFVLDNVTFQEMNPASTFILADFDNNEEVNFNNITFDSPVTTGAYFEFDSAGVNGSPSVTFVNASPSVDCLSGTVACVPGDFAPTGAAASPATWIGALVDNSWSNPANWTTGIVPNAQTIVTIPGGVDWAPITAGNVEVAGLIIENNGTLTIGIGDTLNVFGSVDIQSSVIVVAGDNASTLRIRTQPAGSTLSVNAADFEPRLLIDRGIGSEEGTVTVSGFVSVATGNDSTRGVVVAAGVLDLAGNEFYTYGGLRVRGTGRLSMTNPSSLLQASRVVEFAGPSTDGYLTAGRLRVADGHFRQLNTVSNESFVSTGSHTVDFAGNAASGSITVQSMSPTTSRFNNVEFNKGSLNMSFGADTVFVENINYLNAYLAFNGGSLVVSGSLKDSIDVVNFQMNSPNGIVDLRGTLPSACGTNSLNVTGYKGQFIPNECHTEPLAFFAMTSNTGQNLNAVLVVDGQHGIAVGDGGTIATSQLNSDSISFWNDESEPSEVDGTDFFGLASVNDGSDNRYYVVGANGTIIKKIGEASSWDTMTSGVSVTLRSILAVAPDSIYAVGDLGTILFFNGSDWSPVTNPAPGDLYTVVRSNDTLFVAGDIGGLLWSVDGSTWTARSTSYGGSIRSFVEPTAGERFFGGTFGGFFRMMSAGFQSFPVSPGPTSDDIRGLSSVSQYGLGVGHNGLALHRQGLSWTASTVLGSQNLNATTAFFYGGRPVVLVVGEFGSIYWVTLGPVQ